MKSQFYAASLKIIIALLGGMFLFGCTPTKVISYPTLPNTGKTVRFNLDTVKVEKFVSENGNNSITKDNVTVIVEDITEVINDDHFSTEIEGPTKKNYRVGITPMMLVLNVKNDTNHIITLRQTIIKIEDENQNDYPLISNIPEAKNDLRKRVEIAFDDFLEQTDNVLKADILKSAEYKSNYESFVTELKTAKRRGDVRTPDMEENKILTQVGVDDLIEKRSPKEVYNTWINHYRNKVLSLKGKAIQKIYNDIDNNVSNIITSGVYPAISLLPGRVTKIIVPFNTRTPKKQITSLVVNVFDVPTKVDQASNPTKREHFSFKLVKAQ